MYCAALALLAYTLSGLGRGVFDYQTLPAGGDAVVAACYAAPPVNRQLDIMRPQSGAVIRCMLPDRPKKTFQLSVRTLLRFFRGSEVAFPQSVQFVLKHVT